MEGTWSNGIQGRSIGADGLEFRSDEKVKNGYVGLNVWDKTALFIK
ncbi:hypothetical protein GI584_04250 [Gracilibacillus salitolerans]|uniref:Uncharacterized protein n=1 Tax=Gracilibacillus salitolerans TaxID=2663022 RepID=A0A5Q2TGG3_9BACI|nr:hypothetical protein [Gracilibacillus salitolerans]QGH33297.1 hypothetical protein GI584_04250 [Gracilibacillus salitolerans]